MNYHVVVNLLEAEIIIEFFFHCNFFEDGNSQSFNDMKRNLVVPISSTLRRSGEIFLEVAIVKRIYAGPKT